MLVKKDDLLSFTVRIPRQLHDELDKIREAAKTVDATYDPAPALIKALRKDITLTQKAIEAVKRAKATASPSE